MVCLVGIFSPTGGGQAAVNRSFRQLVESTGTSTKVIDLSPRTGQATWTRRFSRAPKVALGILQLLRISFWRSPTSIYIAVSGGLGQVYDLVFIAIGRVLAANLYVHHDSYAYLLKKNGLASLLIRAAGPRATHIVLCEDMNRRLRQLYLGEGQTVVISNATNTEEPIVPPKIRAKLISIGFISNLSRAKGVVEFFDLAERLCAARPGLRALLAGPIEEPSLRPILHSRLSSAPWVTYLGPIYGDEKSRFFADIDVLILPSRYVHEAEPKVVGEALAHGVVVVATNRGCIGTVLSRGGGVTIAESADFVTAAELIVLKLCSDAAVLASLSASALRCHHELREQHAPRINQLIDSMVSANGHAG